MSKARLGLLAGLAAVVTGLFAAAASAAAPVNTAPPTISGTPKAGATLTADDGTWSNSPTTFTYVWQRCASDGRGCGDITSATAKTYSPSTSDVGHALRVVVTASNADGKAAAVSAATDPISSANGPTNTVRPSVTGAAVVGSTLRVSNGSWSPAAASYGRQWQRCASDGSGCTNIAGANGQSYGVGGNTTTTVVTTTTTTTTPAPPVNHAPRLSYLSLRIRHGRAYARFRICDDRTGRITIVERDNHNRVLSVTHRFHVTLVASCNSYAKSWILRRGFRTRGRYVSSARAVDAQGRLGLIKSRSVTFR